MKKLLMTLLWVGAALTSEAATKSDTLVVTTTPVMHCQGCENKIKSNIRFVKGTKKIETSLQKQLVTIIYDGRKAKPADYIEAFRKINFEVKVLKQ